LCRAEWQLAGAGRERSGEEASREEAGEIKESGQKENPFEAAQPIGIRVPEASRLP
jgi:hypothetical protein